LTQVNDGPVDAAQYSGMNRIILCALALASLALASCERAGTGTRTGAEPATQTFVVQGILRGIDFAGRSITVEHEEIAGFMPAMTMPFDVRTMTEVEPLKSGEAIEFSLFVNARASWIEGVKKIDPSEIRLPEKKAMEGGLASDVARLKEGDMLPEFQLVDSQGRRITRATFAGKPLLITFIFTRCPIPNFCPLMTNNFREIQQALAEAPDRQANVQLLSISFDSAFDTPEVLAQYAALHTRDSDQWRFATGSAEETQRLTQAFSVTVQTENGLFNHGLATVLVTADGVIRRIWRGNGWKSVEVVETLRAL
jgi:protein SCO1/2